MNAREVELLQRLVEDIRENPRPVWLYEEDLSAIESALELWLPDSPEREQERERMARFMERVTSGPSPAAAGRGANPKKPKGEQTA